MEKRKEARDRLQGDCAEARKSICNNLDAVPNVARVGTQLFKCEHTPHFQYQPKRKGTRSCNKSAWTCPTHDPKKEMMQVSFKVKCGLPLSGRLLKQTHKDRSLVARPQRRHRVITNVRLRNLIVKIKAIADIASAT